MNASLPQDDPSDAPSIDALLRFIEVYRQHVPSGSVVFLHTFLLIAARRPIVMSEIARVLGHSLPSISNALDSLGEGGPKVSKEWVPPGVVDRVDHPVDARMKLAGLTPRGEELIEKMRAALVEKGRG